MKQILKRSVSLIAVLALMVSMMSVIGSFTSMTASAATTFPVHRQWETKWKSVYYGGRSVYDTACGVFAIVNSVGYLTGGYIDVKEACQWAYNIKAYNYYSGGTERGRLYPKLQAKYGATYGFTVDTNGGGGYWAGASSSKLKNHLSKGGVAIGHVKGHFIAVVGYDASSNKFRIYDSAPSSSRGTNKTGEGGYGDVWVTQSWFSTSTKLTLDWFVLLTATGEPVNGGTQNTTEKIGTYRVNSKAPASDLLNIRAGAGTSYSVVDTMVEGDLAYCSDIEGSWLKIKKMSNGVEGYISSSYADYIGVDVLGGTGRTEWGTYTTSIDDKGQLTIVNQSLTENAAYDLYLPISIGTATTPYMSLQITPNYGNGYYFGLTQAGSGYWMMRDCTSSNQLVVAESAPYMTGQETLEINVNEWWKPEGGQTIDCVRLYVAPNSSVTFNYFYFAATSGKVKDTTYNLVRGNGSTNSNQPLKNENLLDPNVLSIVDPSLSGEYIYDNGNLEVTANSASGYAVKLDLNKSFDPSDLDRLLISVSTDVRYDIELTVTTTDGDRTFGLAADFASGITGAMDGDFIPAMSGSRGLDFKSCYTWNNVLPATSVIKSVKIELGGQGSLTIGGLQIANEDVLSVYNDGLYFEGNSPSSVVMGDVNLDGTVTTSDARETMLYTLTESGFSAPAYAAADFNNDGSVNTSDARDILLSTLM